MATETTHYNVYRVRLAQPSGIDHEGIALVPAQFQHQGAGRFYDVQGTVGLGMDLVKRPAYHFQNLDRFKSKVFEFQIEKICLAEWEALVEKQPPPHDPRVLLEKCPDPPARNCSTWVDEVLENTKVLAVENKS